VAEKQAAIEEIIENMDRYGLTLPDLCATK